jgi:hypothetical protein
VVLTVVLHSTIDTRDPTASFLMISLHLTPHQRSYYMMVCTSALSRIKDPPVQLSISFGPCIHIYDKTGENGDDQPPTVGQMLLL